jgi:RNA polymerase sigma-70 factor, ECF subfamily
MAPAAGKQDRRAAIHRISTRQTFQRRRVLLEQALLQEIAAALWKALPGYRGAASAEQRLLDLERRGLLLEAIRAPPLADRPITVLHLEGLSGADIEQVTGLSEGAVATRLTRIRGKLRKH